MTVNKDMPSKRLRVIQATLAAGDAGASQLNFTIDSNAPTAASFPTKDFLVTNIKVTSAAGAEKTGVTRTYVRSGTSAGILQVGNGTVTFATGDEIVITGTYL